MRSIIKVVLFFIFLASAKMSFAQDPNVVGTKNCPKYEHSITKGNQYLRDGNSSEALKRFQDAQIAARQCGIQGKEAALGIANAFKSIEGKRKQALSLALSGQANTEVFVNHDLTKGFRFAQYAYCRDSTNADAQRIIYTCARRPLSNIQHLYSYASLYNESKITTVKFSGESGVKVGSGSRVLVVSEDGIAKVWDVASGKLVGKFGQSQVTDVLQIHMDENFAGDISADGKMLLTAFNSEEAQLWDIDSHKIIETLHSESGIFKILTFSSDGKRAVSNDENYHQVLWNTSNGEKIALLDNLGLGAWIFSDNCAKLLGRSENAIRIVDAGTGKELIELDTTNWCTTFSPDMKRIIVTEEVHAPDYSLLYVIYRVWDSEKGKLQSSFKKQDCSWRTKVSFSSDENRIILIGSDQPMKRTNKIRCEIRSAVNGIIMDTLTMNDHVQDVLSANGKTWYVYCKDSFYRFEIGDRIKRMESKPFAFSKRKQFRELTAQDPNEDITMHYFGASENGVPEIWDVASATPRAETEGNYADIIGSGFSDKDDVCYTISKDNTIRLFKTGWVPPSTSFIRCSALSKSKERFLKVEGSDLKVTNVDNQVKYPIIRTQNADFSFGSFSNNGRLLLACDGGNRFAVWNTDNGKKVSSWICLYKAGYSAVFSPDNKVVMLPLDNGLSVYDVNTGLEKYRFPHPVRSTADIVFSPDGRLFMIYAKTCDGLIYSTTTGKSSAALQNYRSVANENEKRKIIFSADSKRILSVSDGNVAKIWSTDDGKEIYIFKGHQGPINDIALSPDERYVITGSEDGTAKIWTIQDGKQKTLSGNNSHVIYTAFSPNGKVAITCDQSNTTKLWDVESGTMSRFAGTTETGSYAKNISPDNKLLLTSDDGNVKLWDINSKTLVYELKSVIPRRLQLLNNKNLKEFSFSDDGKSILIYDDHSCVRYSIDFKAILTDMAGRTADLSVEEKRKYGIVY